MSLTRRLLAVVALVLFGLVTFSATTVAFDLRSLSSSGVQGKGGGGGGAGLPPAGNYQSGNVFAGIFLCCAGPTGTMQVSVNVSHQTSKSNPLVGPTTTTDEVDVFFSVNDFTSGVFISGCIIPDRSSDFAVNSKLTAATLSTTVQTTTQTCQGQTLNGVTPPFTLNATWAVAGAISSSSRVDKYSCASYTSETQTSGGGSSNASASFSASFLSAPISTTGGANLFSNSQFTHAQGTPPAGCIGLGGKGAGPGPQVAGNYTNSSMSAFMQVQPDDATQNPFSVSVTSFTNTAHPVGAPISTLTETDLNFFQFNFFQFVQDCWVVPASDVAIAPDLHTASLNASIDSNTPACQNANNTGLPATFTISATWTATSPLADFSNVSQGGCGSVHTSGTQHGSGVTATATGVWPGVAASFTDPNAFMSTNNSNLHIQGSFTGC